ncbi:MAG: hypothetical protein AAB354_02460 [candidate division KSB1 bacterium]
MKYSETIIALLLVPALAVAQELSVNDLRKSFYQAADDKQAAQQFFDKLAAVDESAQPLLLGYKGMACFMICQHALNPYAKVKYFIQGKTALEKAVERDPQNLELRYLRFTVQTNAPEFLGYTRNVLKDKAFILNSLKSGADESLEEDLRKRIIEYLRTTKYCTAREKNEIESYSAKEEN